MKQINFNAETGEVTTEDVPDFELSIVKQEPTESERLEALESAMLEMIIGGGAV